jgi:uncharacterized protein YjaG (DUF416 family)
MSKLQNKIIEKLLILPFAHQLNWLRCLLQESLPFYLAFSRETSFGKPELFEEILAILEKQTALSEAVLENLQLELTEAAPDTDNFSMLSASLALNVCVMADYALLFLQNKDVLYLQKVWESRVEMAEMLFLGKEEVNLHRESYEKALSEKPEFQDFLIKEAILLVSC